LLYNKIHFLKHRSVIPVFLLILFLIPFGEKLFHVHHDTFSSVINNDGSSRISEICPVCNYELCASTPEKQQLPEKQLILLENSIISNVETPELASPEYSFLLRAPPVN
jgi:hypothetical protein